MAKNLVLDALTRVLRPRIIIPPISPEDQMFLERFHETVTLHQSESPFTTEDAAAALGISRMHLNRKVHALTGVSTHEYIRQTRLEGAKVLLSEQLPVAFIAKSFGFRSMSHFAKAFRQQFGVKPSVYHAAASSGFAAENLKPRNTGNR
jgi:AraC-like DNA-binding protein